VWFGNFCLGALVRKTHLPGAAIGAGAVAVTGGSVTQGAVIGGGVGAATGAATDEEDINLE